MCTNMHEKAFVATMKLFEGMKGRMCLGDYYAPENVQISGLML